MSDADIEDLQVRLAHQELAIEELNATVTRHDRLVRELVAELRQVREILRELRPSPLGSDQADEPPPPHY
ncbi:MAG: SlyX family protein [Gammaproteobacteria bacterium]|nr:SlyX family protein [Gammaproteobacteria bacterium]